MMGNIGKYTSKNIAKKHVYNNYQKLEREQLMNFSDNTEIEHKLET